MVNWVMPCIARYSLLLSRSKKLVTTWSVSRDKRRKACIDALELTHSLSSDNESLGEVVPIRITDIVAGATHAFAVLNNITNVNEQEADTSVPNFGYDVYGWGHNFHSQVGNGKRNNIAHPIHPETLAVENEPHNKDGSYVNRLQLAPVTHVKTKVSDKVKTFEVDQKIEAGVGISTVYSRVRH
jgi:hypothetical protein